MKKNLKGLVFGLLVVFGVLLSGCQKKEMTVDETNEMYRKARTAAREYAAMDKVGFPDIQAVAKKHKVDLEMLKRMSAASSLLMVTDAEKLDEIVMLDFNRMTDARYRNMAVEFSTKVNDGIRKALESNKYQNRTDIDLYNDNETYKYLYDSYEVEVKKNMRRTEDLIEVRELIFKETLAGLYEAGEIELLSTDQKTIDAFIKYSIELRDRVELETKHASIYAYELSEVQWYFIEEGDEETLPLLENRDIDNQITDDLVIFTIKDDDNFIEDPNKKVTDSGCNITLGITKLGTDTKKYMSDTILTEGEYEIYIDSDNEIDAILYGYTKDVYKQEDKLVIYIYSSMVGKWQRIYDSSIEKFTKGMNVEDANNHILIMDYDSKRDVRYIQLSVNSNDDHVIKYMNWYVVEDGKGSSFINKTTNEENYLLQLDPNYSYRNANYESLPMVNPKF